jgi:hypothetical protein
VCFDTGWVYGPDSLSESDERRPRDLVLSCNRGLWYSSLPNSDFSVLCTVKILNSGASILPNRLSTGVPCLISFYISPLYRSNTLEQPSLARYCIYASVYRQTGNTSPRGTTLRKERTRFHSYRYSFFSKSTARYGSLNAAVRGAAIVLGPHRQLTTPCHSYNHFHCQPSLPERTLQAQSIHHCPLQKGLPEANNILTIRYI